MDRSFAGRLGIGSLTRPPARKKARPERAGAARGGAKRRGTRGGAANPIDVAIAHLLRAPSALVRGLSGGWAFVHERKRLRMALVATLVALPLLGGGWLWLRHSSLVAVEHVRVSGVHGSDARAIDAALTSAAKRMSTLDVNASRLRAAVAAYPVVGDLRVHASFPHGLSIEVIEQLAGGDAERGRREDGGGGRRGGARRGARLELAADAGEPGAARRRASACAKGRCWAS